MEARGPILSVLLALATIATGAAPGLANSSTEGVPGVRMLVGFEELPRDELADGEWANRTVLEVIDGVGVAVIEAEDASRFRAMVGDRSNLAFVERDRALRPTYLPNDPRFVEQDAPPQIDLPGAWDHTLGNRSIMAAVVDSGIRNDHEDLAGAVEAERDFAEDDDVAQDECGHGTLVAGTLGARTDNGVGIAGASNAGLLDAKVIQPHQDKGCLAFHSDIAQAIEWSADQGADVISMSLGGPDASDTVNRSIAYAADAGALLVASAGNNGTCTDCVNYPARHPEVIAVACTDDLEERCSFSSRGPEIELAAPGWGVLTTTVDGGYGSASGTSLSAPFVSGTATLMLSVKPSLDRSQLRSLLQETAQDLGPDGRDTETGFGEVHAERAVVEAGDINRPPEADFVFDCVSLTCSFDGSGSTDPDGDELSYRWSLGDGTERTGETVEHTYAEGGTYTVELNVTDGQAFDTETGDVTVDAQLSFDVTPTKEVYRPTEEPQLVAVLEGASTGDGVPGVTIDGWTRWSPAGPLSDTVAGDEEAALLADPLVADTLRSSDVLYHEITGETGPDGIAVLDVPGEAGSSLWAPTPGHEVHVVVTATVDGADYQATTSYQVSTVD